VAVEMDNQEPQQQTLVEAVVEVMEAGLQEMEALVLLILVVVAVAARKIVITLEVLQAVQD